MEQEIKDLVKSTVDNAFKEIEVSNIRKEVEELRSSNKQLVEKLASAEAQSIPEEKVDEITAVVEKALGDKVDSMVGEALQKAIAEHPELNKPKEKEEIKEEIKEEVKEEKAPEVEEEFKVKEKEEVEETAMTDRQRIKKALTSRRHAKRVSRANAFKPMSRQSIAYTSLADADEQLEALTETLKNAKSKQEIEEVKKLLQAFIASSKKATKMNVAEDLQKEVSDDLAELEAYRALGSIEEVEAAVEVIETYADEIGSLQELKEASKQKEALANKRAEVLKRRKAILSHKKRVAARRALLSQKRKEKMTNKEVKNSSRIEKLMKLKKQEVKPEMEESKECKKSEVSSKRKAIIAERVKALKAKRAESSKKVENSARVEKIKALKERRMKLSSIKEQIKTNISMSSKDNTPGSMATALFNRNK